MQVFMPIDDFYQTAVVLDNKRLFKQVLEARQILVGLGEDVKKNDGTSYSPTHTKHPIYNLWRGYNTALKIYHDVLLCQAIKRDIQTKIQPFYNLGFGEKILFDCPSWFGREDFHSRHRAALLAKNPEWYGQFGWKEEPKIDYLWE